MSATLPAMPAATPAAPTSRVASVDLIRGAVMILMAIDDVYFPCRSFADLKARRKDW